MYFSSFFTALPLLAVCSASPHYRRAVTSDVQLYAYGTNISALPLYYGVSDGLVYIADNPGSGYSNLTWTIDGSGALPWNATISNSTAVAIFYIVNDGSSYGSTGFITSSNSTTNVTNAITTGFAMFGGQVVLNTDSELESKFWAETTSSANIWALKWNSDGSSQADSTPVVIKKTGLSTSTDSTAST